MLKKVQCNEQRWPKATLPESAKHEKSPDHPQIDLEDPTRAIRSRNFVMSLHFSQETVSVRRGRRR